MDRYRFIEFILENTDLSYRAKALYIFRDVFNQTLTIERCQQFSTDRENAIKKELERLTNTFYPAYDSYRRFIEENGYMDLADDWTIFSFRKILEDRRLSWRSKGIAMYLSLYSVLEETTHLSDIIRDGTDSKHWILKSIEMLKSFEYIKECQKKEFMFKKSSV